MADSYNYQTGTYSVNGGGWNALMDIVATFLTVTVGGGWTLDALYDDEFQTISGNPNAFRDWYTHYFKLTPGPGKDDSIYFFLTAGSLGPDIRCGVLDHWVDPNPSNALKAGSTGVGYDYFWGFQDKAQPAITWVTGDISGDVTYHLFGGFEGSGTFLYCVIETPDKEYSHFGFGRLDKIGNYNGGEFACGQMWWENRNNESNDVGSNYHVRMFDSNNINNAEGTSSHLNGGRHQWNTVHDYPNPHVYMWPGYEVGMNNDHLLGGDDAARYYTYGGPHWEPWQAYGCSVGGMNTPFLANGISTFNGNALFNVDYTRVYDQIQGAWIIIGQAPAFRSVRMDQIQENEVVGDYVVFPVKSRNIGTLGTDNNSRYYGWAYRKT